MEFFMRPSWLPALVVLGTLTLTSPARSDFVWEFDLAGVPTTNFIIPTVGGTVDVQIYLKETNGGNTLTTQGLFSAGVQVQFNSPSGVAAVLPTDPNNSSGVHVNPAFNDSGSYSTPVTTTNAKLSEAVTNPNNPVFPAADGLNRILFGSFTFTAQSAGTVTLTATRFNPSPDDRIITGQGNPLDSSIPNGSAQILVPGVATPEPGTLLLAGMAGMGLAGWGIRRRRHGAHA
jgi:hypothetical protein